MPNHWTDLIAWGVVLAAGLFVARRVWRSLAPARGESAGCGSCGSCAASRSPSDPPVVQINLSAPGRE